MSFEAKRPTIVIDEEKCDGCGQCVPSCAEGAIQIIAGKARVLEQRCDGLGHCLGACPRGAISIVEAAAPARKTLPSPSPPAPQRGCACAGAAERRLSPGRPRGDVSSTPAAPASSQLGHWPVQLHLLPIDSPLWDEADVLIAADCVGFAMPDFHTRLLGGKTLAVGCPKLDDIDAYSAKLEAIFGRHRLRSVTVAHMEVPCCSSILPVVREALNRAGQGSVSIRSIIVGLDGMIREDRQQAGHCGC